MRGYSRLIGLAAIAIAAMSLVACVPSDASAHGRGGNGAVLVFGNDRHNCDDDLADALARALGDRGRGRSFNRGRSFGRGNGFGGGRRDVEIRVFNGRRFGHRR